MTTSKGLFGHPPGLTTLFMIEVWERASYYGMRAILTLYMVAAITSGGLGFSAARATELYGTYTGAVYLTPLLGGFIADRLLGPRRTLLIGGVIIALGHFSLVFATMPSFYCGLALIVAGTGLLKPNISTMVGHLYEEGDARRNAGFNLVYMGINIGGALAPLVCGFLAQSQSFKNMLAHAGFDPIHSWHWAFAAAGVGMLFGLLQYWLHRKRLSNIGGKPMLRTAAGTKNAHAGAMSKHEWHRLGAISVLFVASMFFWMVVEQSGSSITLFADKLVNTSIFGWQFPSTWLQSLNSIFVIALTPLFAWLWVYLSKRGTEPSSPAKFSVGLVFLGIGTALMVPASIFAMSGKISWLWLLGLYFFQTVGELCLSPIGLATVSELAPVRFANLIMGAWFLSVALGNKLAGQLAGFSDVSSPMSFVWLFGSLGVAALVIAGSLWMLTPRVKKLMQAT